MKFIILSIVLHFLIFISSYTTIIKSKDFEIEEVGNSINTKIVSVDFMDSSNSKKESLDNSEKKEEKTEVKEKEKEKVQNKEKNELKKEKVKKEEVNQKKEKDEKIEKEILKNENKNTGEQDTNNNQTNQKSQESDSFDKSSSSLIELSKGVFAVKNQGVKGLKFQFISNPEPEYPLVAKRLGYSKDVSVKVRFLVGYNGEIEDIKFYGEEDTLGFQEEVRATLKKWKLTPITLYEVPVKLYFYKEFKFNKI